MIYMRLYEQAKAKQRNQHPEISTGTVGTLFLIKLKSQILWLFTKGRSYSAYSSRNGFST